MFNSHAFPLSMARAMYKYIHFQPIITSGFPGGGEKTTSLIPTTRSPSSGGTPLRSIGGGGVTYNFFLSAYKIILLITILFC
jgi:hypothetical protein